MVESGTGRRSRSTIARLLTALAIGRLVALWFERTAVAGMGLFVLGAAVGALLTWLVMRWRATRTAAPGPSRPARTEGVRRRRQPTRPLHAAQPPPRVRPWTGATSGG